MNLVDANVLLYAVNESDPKHLQASSWLDDALNATETVGFCWPVLLAFIRLSTKIGLFPNPLPVEGAIDRVQRWIEQPTAVVVEPTSRHISLIAGILRQLGTGGNLTSDAHIAALAIEHDATVISYDADFSRFDGLKWKQPVSP